MVSSTGTPSRDVRSLVLAHQAADAIARGDQGPHQM